MAERCDEDKAVEDFLAMHIPKGTREYAPAGSGEISYITPEMAEHFTILTAEEGRVLAKFANLRFVG